MATLVNDLQSTSGDNSQKPRYIDLDEVRQAIVGRLTGLKPETDRYASEFVDGLFAFARKVGTSDLHLQPTRTGLQVQFRHDGVLQTLGVFPAGAKSSIVSRLKIMSDLLTYQADVPQEGRVADAEGGPEVRVSTFPTLYGERTVLRFFGNGETFLNLEDLGHTCDTTQKLKNELLQTSGAILVTGPAGSGKSTTLYACMRHLVNSTSGSRSLVSIEDPIEVPVDGVAQSKVNLAAGFDLDTGLRSILRQDPEVILVGEVRDRSTAEIAIQASLTGQLVLTTFHADSAATAISRLTEMGIEPYLLRSGLNAVMSQRLIRLLCDCSKESRDPADLCGLPVESARVPRGCGRCNDSGYQGRAVISEFLSLRDTALASAVLCKSGGPEINRLAIESGMVSLWEQATNMVRAGRTSPLEVRRVLGAA